MRVAKAVAVLLLSMAATAVLAQKEDFTDPDDPASLPPLPFSYQGLWWNESESGWGVNFTHQGFTLFATLFTYDASGAPLWLVMSAGKRLAGASYAGALFRTTGPPFNANPFTPIGAGDVRQVGSMLVTFIGPDEAVLEYSVNRVTVRKSIRKQVFGARAASCAQTVGSRAALANYQDLWWNPEESGWGINVTHQDNTLFATLFTYDSSGGTLWLVMSKGERQADGSYLGTLYSTRGPAFDAQPFSPIKESDIATVGTMRLSFSDGDNGMLAYTYQAATVVKRITRQVFDYSVTACR